MDSNLKKILIIVGFVVTTGLFIGWIYLAFVDMVAWAFSWIGIAELIILGFGYFTVSFIELLRNSKSVEGEGN